MRKFENISINVSAFGDNLRAQKPHGWRAVINGHGKVIPLTNIVVTGVISPKNYRYKKRKKPNRYGIMAWVSHFGDVIIDNNDVAHINLK